MSDILFAFTIGTLFAIGVFQILRRDLVKVAMGFGLLFTAVNLFILAAGAYDGIVAPYTENVDAGIPTSDPLVQALILTAVVVGFGSYALLLGMISIASRRYDTADSDEVSELKQ